MGCDIHLITEVRKDGKWEYVPEVVTEWKTRNYTTFAVLANVRNDFDTKGFEPKGLPEDISGKHFNFQSEIENITRNYKTRKDKFVRLPDGSLISYHDPCLKKQVASEEEANDYGGWSCCNGIYYVQDPSLVNGELVEIPIKDRMSIDEYKAECWKDEWNEEVQDYGYWRVDFDCCDYHSHSWLTLQELLDFDQTDYLATKVKVPKVFYDKFVELGGIIPEGMTVTEEYKPGDMIEAIRQAFNPDVLVGWVDESKKEHCPLQKGINELLTIADKYGVSPIDIRIVFAFDN